MASIDSLWKTSIQQLTQLLKLEEETTNVLKLNNGGSSEELFEGFMKIYVGYVQILRQLDKCQDMVAQPQMREDIQRLERFVICNIVEIKYMLHLKAPSSKHSENILLLHALGEDMHRYLDKAGVDKVSILEPFIPCLFHEIKIHQNLKRKELIEKLVKEIDKELPINETNPNEDSETNGKTKFEAEIIQKISSINDEPILTSSNLTTETTEDEVNEDVTNPPTGDFTQMSWILLSKQEKDCVSSYYTNKDYATYQTIKKDQAKNQEAYNNALSNIKPEIERKEGWCISEVLWKERMTWVEAQIKEKGKIPETIDLFYVEEANDNQPPPGAELQNAEKKKAEDTDASILLVNMGETRCLRLIQELKSFEKHWATILDHPNCMVGHFDDMLKDRIVRPEIKEQHRRDVDAKLNVILARMKEVEAGKEPKKLAKKKGGKAKGKSKKKSGKEKPLPGAKVADLKDMETKDMFKCLIRDGIISIEEHPTTRFKSFLADCYSQGRAARVQEDMSGEHLWAARIPSLQEMKSILSDLCVLPNCLPNDKDMINPTACTRSLLLYGLPGSGKSMLLDTIVSELDAICIDLSPSKLEGKFSSEDGPTRLIHMAFSVATDPAFAPVVIKLEDCDNIFAKKGKRKGPAALQTTGSGKRFQKDLLIYKNRMLMPHHKVIIIGTTRYPMNCDVKVLKWKGPKGNPEKQGFFETFLFVPPATYVDRLHLWKGFLGSLQENRSKNMLNEHLPELNYHHLAQLSDASSISKIKDACEKAITCSIPTATNEGDIEKRILESLVGQSDQKQALEALQRFSESLVIPKEIPVSTDANGKQDSKKTRK